MQRRQRIVFGGMPGPQQQEIPGPNDDPDYKFNTLVFEIGANWEFVIEMMKGIENGSKKTVDPLERDWLNFILQNHIDVNRYSDSDQFVEALFKNKK